MGDEGSHGGGSHGADRAGDGDVRIGDAERQAVVDALSRHAGAGRLTLDEFAERAGEVFATRTREALDAVLADLPTGLPASEAQPVPAGHDRGDETVDADRAVPRRRRFVAIMSAASARGRWRAPKRIKALAFWGGVKIDLRDAVITSAVVKIKASAYMGGVTVIVPEGIPVDVHGFVLMGGTRDRTGAGRHIEGAPVVQIRARGLWGGVTVVSRPRLAPAERDERRRRREQARRERLDHLWGVAHHDRRYGSRASAHRPPGGPDPSDAHRPAGALPPPSVDDALPTFGDLHAMAKVALRDKLAAAGLIDLDTPAPSPSTGAQGPGRPAGTANGSAPDVPGSPEAPDSPGSDGGRLPVGTLTMLVTDIVRSTQHAEQLGDQRWMEVLRAHNGLVRSQVAYHGGTEVKAQGDGFLCVFPSARQAILAAIETQRSMAKYRADQPEHQVELRIGLHTGEVVADDDDIHGQNVVVAVRIADAAAPSEILVSGLTHDLTASSGDLHFGSGRDITLKGVTEVRRVHPVDWE